MPNLRVNEIFYSLQGEGGMTGQAAIFIRLTGCNLDCDFCDTNHKVMRSMSLQEIAEQIRKFKCDWIIWTGGEPALQLNEEILNYFSKLGYLQAIETNGTITLPKGFDYITISPKGKQARQIEKIDEYRVLLTHDTTIDDILKYEGKSSLLFVSPQFDNQHPNYLLLNKAIELCKSKTNVLLSVQLHKLIGIE